MTADKRKVSTDALETLGTLIDENQHRDAIHLAVEPIVALEELFPGQHVGIIDGKASATAKKKLGIVDPFLTTNVLPGRSFWLVVYPRQITSLRHVWSHPDFKEVVAPIRDDAQRESLEWISKFAGAYNYTADRMIQAATDYIDRGEYLCDGGLFEGESVPEEFWKHYNVVTGRNVDVNADDFHPTFFTCSC